MSVQTTVDKLTDRRDGVPSQRPLTRVRPQTNNRVQPTPADRLEAQKKREDHRERYARALAAAQDVVWKQAEALHKEFGNHDVSYYFEEVIQRGHLTQTQRAPSRWNAFLKLELADINSKLPDGAARYKSHQIVNQCSAKWGSMSAEEHIAVTDTTMEELAARKKARATAPHHVSLNSFHDVHANIERISKELKDLHARTGTEILLVAVRSTAGAFNRPFFFHTSEQVSEFFSLGFKLPLGEIVSMLVKHEQSFLELKKSTAAFISNKLEHLIGAKIRMNYANFDDAITRKFGLIIKNWPLAVFTSPGDIRTVSELKVLHSAWTSEVAHFYRLTKEEFGLWLTSKSHPGATTENMASESSDSTLSPTSPSPPIVTEEFSGGASLDNPSHQDRPSPEDVPCNAVFRSYDIPPSPDDLNGTASAQPTAQDLQPASLQPAHPTVSPSFPQDENEAPRLELPNKRRIVEEVPVATKRRRQGLTEFVNTNIPTDSGTPLVITKKPRKVRSDKGKKRARRE